MDLSVRDREMLSGERGEAVQLAMKLLVAVGEAEDAPHLIDVIAGHIDACLFHGVAGLDFAERLVEGGGEVAVPTTLNVSSLDLIHPDLYRGDPETARLARRLMDAYVAMGCRPTWTCAPYQLSWRPSTGDQIAWGESNAIVFANSVLGARTNRYGDFLDICAALTGRAPYTGLHTDEGRLGDFVVELQLEDGLLDDEVTYALIGHAVGKMAGVDVPVIVGLDPDRVDEDRLKNLGAASASSGAVAMFHAVGVTPEAPTLEAATGGREVPTRILGTTELEEARRQLSRPSGRLGAVSVGTPHMSINEMRRLAELVGGRTTKVPFYVNTSRDVYEVAREEGLAGVIEAAGIEVVTDTCTYITPIMGEIRGDLMTNSGKLAYYAPANLGANVALASLADCVESAMTGGPAVGES
ncbi:MAG: aconitase X catalytic domain-containing protein [Acidimicrobiales bacterium]|nr:aconitase X catalytic domain-containing protein [Acidimicrobiales bacterium]HLV90568.1 aconitase X catalytic domain-containing protein [Acidimicrobiia bacterium]